ncbi:MAG: DUF1205 domain-containing protein [Actinobacteria bacterium]|nr:DUF1205 domain-containing protein [Actinomycetota bacterium]
MVPLAWALRCAGHQVVVAGPRPIANAVRAAGLVHVPVGELTPLDLWSSDAGPAGDRDFSIEPWVELAEGSIAAILGVIKQWRADLVCSDFVEFAGPVAAARCGVVSVVHQWGMHMSSRLLGALFHLGVQSRLRALGERFDVAPEDAAPTATLTLCPPSLAAFDATGWLPLRHIPYCGSGIVSPWLFEARTRPRICVTMGSVGIDAGVTGLRDTVEGLADLDVDVVLVGPGARSSELLNELPGNVRALSWMAFDQLFGTCDLVVHHGGSGTAMNALQFGLPQLVLPQMCDQFDNSERLVAAGCARAVGFKERAPQVIRRQVEALLGEPSHRYRAQSIGREIEAMPAPGAVVGHLEALAIARRRAAPPVLAAR